MRPNVIDLDVADEDTDGIANDLTGAGPWTPNVASAPSDGLCHQLSLSSAANLSGITITIVGTGVMGEAVSEARAGPNANTVETTAYFSTVTSITAGATLGANTMDIGWVDEVISITYPISWSSPYAANLHADVTGTMNFTLQQTFANVLAGETPVWTTQTAAGTSDVVTTAAIGATAVRVLINSYSSGAEIQLYTSQAERSVAVEY